MTTAMIAEHNIIPYVHVGWNRPRVVAFCPLEDVDLAHDLVLVSLGK